MIVQRFASVGPDGAPNEMDADTVQCSDQPTPGTPQPGCHYTNDNGDVEVAVDAGDFPYLVVAVNWIDPGQQDLEIANAPTSAWGLTTRG